MRAILLLLLTLARPAAAGRVDSLLDQARAAEAAERYGEAAGLYRRALELQPGQYWATVQLAHDDARLGRFEEARRLFERAKKIDPAAQQAYIEEGYAAADAGDEGRAQKDWAELIAKDPSSFLGYHHMGASLLRQGRFRMAEYYLRQSIKRLEAEPDPKPHHDDLMHSLIALGGLLSDHKRYLEAEKMFQEGVDKSRADPANEAQFLGELGQVLAFEGRGQEAQALFDEGTRLCAPPGACFRTAQANLLLDEADVHRRLGEAAKSQDDLDRASRLFEPFGDVPLLAFPASVEQLEQIGESYGGLGAGRKAEAVYRRVIALRPSLSTNETLVEAQANLAGICAKTGRAAEAERLYRGALRNLESRAPLAPRAAKQKAAIVKGLADLSRGSDR